MDKQIEEMIDIQRKNCLGKGVGDCVDADCNACSALAFYNAGYRKIPEGAVVLTKEEHKSLIYWEGKFDELIKIVTETTRKKTVEKFAELAKAKLNEWLEDNEDNDGKIDFAIAEIELIGVETLEGEVIAESLIDEIAEEIMEGK